MREINLLPPELRNKPITLKNIILIVLLISLLGIVMKYAYLDLIQKDREGVQALNELKNEAQDLPDLEDQYFHQQEILKELAQRLLTLRTLEENTSEYWLGVLSSLIDSLPEGAFLTNFNCDNTSLLISGVCPDDKISAKYLRNLIDCGYFAEAGIEKIVYQQNYDAIFTIRCTLGESSSQELEPSIRLLLEQVTEGDVREEMEVFAP